MKLMSVSSRAKTLKYSVRFGFFLSIFIDNKKASNHTISLMRWGFETDTDSITVKYLLRMSDICHFITLFWHRWIRNNTNKRSAKWQIVIKQIFIYIGKYGSAKLMRAIKNGQWAHDKEEEWPKQKKAHTILCCMLFLFNSLGIVSFAKPWTITVNLIDLMDSNQRHRSFGSTRMLCTIIACACVVLAYS